MEFSFVTAYGGREYSSDIVQLKLKHAAVA
jgi:hypothetical protein